MIDLNLVKLIFRTVVFLSVAVLHFINSSHIEAFLYLDMGLFQGVHAVWLFLMLEMVCVMFPNLNNQVACGKLFARHFKGRVTRNQMVLSEITRRYNRRALLMGLVWVLFLVCVGVLYKFRIIRKSFLYLLSLWFYFLDQVFVNVWCPFRVWIIKSKCCTTCRIYNWGHLMMFSPLIFIPTFWTMSLLAVAGLIFLQWEYQHMLHPYRFYEVTNCNLGCSECRVRCVLNPRRRDQRRSTLTIGSESFTPAEKA